MDFRQKNRFSYENGLRKRDGIDKKCIQTLHDLCQIKSRKSVTLLRTILCNLWHFNINKAFNYKYSS